MNISLKEVVIEETKNEDIITHYVCCVEENEGFCGLNLSERNWPAQRGGAASCVVCADIEKSTNNYCPIFQKCIESCVI